MKEKKKRKKWKKFNKGYAQTDVFPEAVPPQTPIIKGSLGCPELLSYQTDLPVVNTWRSEEVLWLFPFEEEMPSFRYLLVAIFFW